MTALSTVISRTRVAQGLWGVICGREVMNEASQ